MAFIEGDLNRFEDHASLY